MQVTREALLQAISEIEVITNETWLATLSSRKAAELTFHDRDRDRTAHARMPQDTYEKFYGNRKYYSGTQASREYVEQWLQKNVPGKVFLDYACGNGGTAIKAAKYGAGLSIGFDISHVSVENAKADAAEHGVSDKTRFFQADAENTRLPDKSVDIVVCSGMLHHLDLSYAFPELRRILTPSGVILAVEALDYNPAIKLYRWLTPAMRTAWEKAHILSLRDVAFAKRFFEIGQIRYWHILGIASPHVGPLAPALHAADSLLTKIPYVQRLAWIFTFELLMREDP